MRNLEGRVISGITWNDGGNQHGGVIVDGAIAWKVDLNSANVARGDCCSGIWTNEG